MLPVGKYEPARGSEVIHCVLVLVAAVAVALWGLSSDDPQIYHYFFPPAGIGLALARFQGWVPGHDEWEREHGMTGEQESGRHEPARGFEKGLCYAIIFVAVMVFTVSVVAGSPSWVSFVAPAFMIFVAVARLKGWVRRGSGAGGGGP